MTLAALDQCSEATARALTDQLRQSLVISWDLLVEAYQRRAWAALGYTSWDSYTDAELGETRLRLPREQRREVVASMAEAGMSTRAISSALGVARNTVKADQREVGQIDPPVDEPIDAEIVDEECPHKEDRSSCAAGCGDDLGDRTARELAASDEQYAEQATSTVGPETANTVLGTDGKTYPAAPAKPPAPRRRPLPEQFWQAAYDLTKVTERIARLADDDRFPRNAEEVAASHRNDLVRAIDALQGVVNRLTPA